ncbi:MAG: glutamine-hydrolyzing carbamoyl-phosphate synthase small subunit [Kiritimatiellaeota bacterium]|nr:glutamine-hydrolyzing carbamoyl-phosphate synthase small subunit [Kiritimatiellota bacterium]
MTQAPQPHWNWKIRRKREAFLALEDGSVFRGWSFGAPRDSLGEVVFNTGMTGYQEILTDPSYHGQIVTMTYTEIGNTGVNLDDIESRRIFANGFIVHELNPPRNWRATTPLDRYLREEGIPAIAGVDTRALTTKLRVAGTQKGFLCTSGEIDESRAVARARSWSGLDNQDYAARVTVDTAFAWDPHGDLTCSWGVVDSSLPEPDLTIAAWDFGIKWNILRRLRQHGMAVTVLPASASAEDVLRLNPDGVFLSNGPADPAAVKYAIENIRALIGRVPIWGICLGHQLLGLALGGRTFRLKFGHHGCNHPVMDLQTRKVEITSQNHNFAVDPDSLDPAHVEVTHLNLNDQTVEGIRHRTEPLFSVQYHPEAAPGPHDAQYLFRRFRDLIAGA